MGASDMIGEKLKKLRGSETQTIFGARFGISRNTVMRYESGERQPDAGFIAAICKEYGINAHWLITGEGEPIGDFSKDDFVSEKSSGRSAQVDYNDINIQEMLNLAAEVLTSDTIYRPALAANIKAFHRAIGTDRDNRDLRTRLEVMESKFEQLERNLLEQDGRDKAAANDA